MQPRRMRNQLDSDINPDGYWNVGSDSVIDHEGTMFAMLMAEQAGVKMMQEYFELEVSESTLMYGYRKGLRIFGDPGYQATVKGLRYNLVGCGYIDVLTEKETTWNM